MRNYYGIVLECLNYLAYKSIPNTYRKEIDKKDIDTVLEEVVSEYYGKKGNELEVAIVENLANMTNERTLVFRALLEAAVEQIDTIPHTDLATQKKEVTAAKKELVSTFDDDVINDTSLAEVIRQKVLKVINKEKANDEKREAMKDEISSAIDNADGVDNDEDIDAGGTPPDDDDEDSEDSDKDDNDKDEGGEGDQETGGSGDAEGDDKDIEEGYFPHIVTLKSGKRIVKSDPLVSYIYTNILETASEEDAPISLVSHITIFESLRAMGIIKDNSRAIMESLDIDYLEALDTAEETEKKTADNKTDENSKTNKIEMLVKAGINTIRGSLGKIKGGAGDKVANMVLGAETSMFNKIKADTLKNGELPGLFKTLYNNGSKLIQKRLIDKNLTTQLITWRTTLQGRLDSIIPEIKNPNNSKAKQGLETIHKYYMALFKELGDKGKEETSGEKTTEVAEGLSRYLMIDHLPITEDFVGEPTREAIPVIAKDVDSMVDVNDKMSDVSDKMDRATIGNSMTPEDRECAQNCLNQVKAHASDLDSLPDEHNVMNHDGHRCEFNTCKQRIFDLANIHNDPSLITTSAILASCAAKKKVPYTVLEACKATLESFKSGGVYKTAVDNSGTISRNKIEEVKNTVDDKLEPYKAVIEKLLEDDTLNDSEENELNRLYSSIINKR